MGYPETPLDVQLRIMEAELANIQALESRIRMWDSAMSEFREAAKELTTASDALHPQWGDTNGDDFDRRNRHTISQLEDWAVKIELTRPQIALRAVADKIRPTYEFVLDSYNKSIAPKPNPAAMVISIPAYQVDSDPGSLSNEVAKLQWESGEEMRKLGELYIEAENATLAARGEPWAPFPGMPAAPVEPAPGGAARASGPAARGAHALAAAGGMTPAPGGVAMGADALGVGAMGADAAAPAEAAVPGSAAGTGGEPSLAGSTGGTPLAAAGGGPSSAGSGGGSSTAGLGGGSSLAGLGSSTSPVGAGGVPSLGGGPSLAGLGGGVAPVLPQPVPHVPTASLPSQSIGGVPFIPPVAASSPGSGLGTGGFGSVGGSSAGVARIPGVSVAAGQAAATIPQAANPVGATAQPTVGAPPAAAPRGAVAPPGTQAGGGGVPPMMPPTTGGGGSSGKPGSGAVQRPPTGRGRVRGPVPGLPGLLSGKVGKAGPKAVPVRSPKARTVPVEPVAPDRLVDEDLWQAALRRDTRPSGLQRPDAEQDARRRGR